MRLLNHSTARMVLSASHISTKLLRFTILIWILPLLTPIHSLADERPWHFRSLVGMEVGPTGAQFADQIPSTNYVSQFNGSEIVRRCVEANADYLVLWVRDGEFTLHHSRWVPSPPGLNQRDVLQEAVDEARKYKLPIIVYCQLQYPAHELRQRPEWKVQQPDGAPIHHLVCFNSPYQDRVKVLLEELLTYDIAGFHLDMVDQGFGPPHGCWCPTCQELFQKEFGVSMPSTVNWNDPNWDKALQFRYLTSDRFEKMLTSHIRRLKPTVTVDFNYHGNPPFAWEVGQTPVRHANNGDFVTGEAGLWAFGALSASFNAAWYRGVTPEKPFQVAVQRGVRFYHDQTTRPLNDMRWELFTLLAHGAFVTMIDKTAYTGWLDPVAYERIGVLFDEAQKKRNDFGHLPVADVGIFFSAQTRDWMGRDNPGAYFQAVQGAHKACVQEHLGFGFLFDENLTAQQLQRYPVICLPNTGILSESHVDLFRQYVHDGGALIITGQSGQFDFLGRPLANSVLSDLIGAQALYRVDGIDNWIRFQSCPSAPQSESLLRAFSKFKPNWPFLVEGPATVYCPTSAIPVAELLNSHRNSLPNPKAYNSEWPLSADKVLGPGLLLHSYGKGKVLTFAGSPEFATASEHGLVETRQVFAQAVRWLHPNPRIRVSAPANVESIVTDAPDSKTLRVHFVAYNPTAQATPPKNRPYILPGLIEDTPIFKAVIETRDPIKKITTSNPTTQVAQQDKRMELIISDIHEVIRIHY